MDSSKTKKPSFKTRLCLCFKPVSPVDDAFEPATYSRILSSALTTVAECKEGSGRSSRKKGGDDSCFWQILKKALNETALLKKIKRRKAANKNQFSRSSSIKSERKADKISKEERKSNRSSLDSSSSSLLTRSSITSSTSSSSSSRTLGSSSSPSSTNNYGNTFGFTIKGREDAKVKDRGKGIGSNNNNNNNNNKALCLIMISSLLVLVFWGKFFAIICTSFCFNLVPRRSEQCNRPDRGDREAEEFDSVEYKKKVIMEGLLERNRSRLSIDSIAKS